MQFSFIVLYRNRDMARVERCLQSIENQSFTDFEILFLDYGSDDIMQQQVAKLCSRFPKVRYVYANTQGWLWCRSHALNLGIAAAKGNYMIIVDVDIIYSPNFAAYFAERITPEKLFLYSCYYLPQSFRNHDQLNFNQNYDYQVSDVSGNGLLVAPKQKILDAGGYDTYFKVWGFEDIDMYQRLKKHGVEDNRISINDLKTFHQWHEFSNKIASMPQSWLNFMRHFWEFKPKGVNTHTDVAMFYDLVNRPAKTIFQQQNATYQVTFSYPLPKSYLQFVAQFTNLEQGQSMSIVQTFQALPTHANSLVAKFFKASNKIFAKTNISYRVTELLTFEKELIEFYQVRDFIFYFLYQYETQIADYYWEQKETHEIMFVVVKK